MEPSFQSPKKTDAFSQMKDLTAVADFHGHLCGGLAFTYRVVGAALRELEISGDPGKHLIASSETVDACGIDTLQVVAGCTMGRGNLKVLDYGKHAFTFIDKRSGRAVRIVRSKDWSLDAIDPVAAGMRERVMKDQATDAEHAEFDRRMENVAAIVLKMPEEELFEIHSFSAEVPKKTKTFTQVECSCCGEMVTENRIVMSNGRSYCIPCNSKEHFLPAV
jgi:formylmethanofuran dehydrogenase subunit E